MGDLKVISEGISLANDLRYCLSAIVSAVAFIGCFLYFLPFCMRNLAYWQWFCGKSEPVASQELCVCSCMCVCVVISFCEWVCLYSSNYWKVCALLNNLILNTLTVYLWIMMSKKNNKFTPTNYVKWDFFRVSRAATSHSHPGAISRL